MEDQYVVLSYDITDEIQGVKGNWVKSEGMVDLKTAKTIYDKLLGSVSNVYLVKVISYHETA